MPHLSAKSATALGRERTMTNDRMREVFASLYDETPDAVVLYDAERRVAAANEAAQTMLGYSQEEIAGRSLSEHMAAADAERVELAATTALRGGSDHFESSARHKDGSIVPVECYVFPARDRGETVGVFVQSHDITALRSAEESLEVNQQRFRSLFEYHPDGIMELKATGAISRVNVSLESETGFYGEQLVGKPWTELVAPERRAQAGEALLAAMRGEAAEHDSLLLDRLGNRLDVQLKLVPVHTHHEIRGAYAIFKNVTAQKTAERTIATQSERVRRLYLVGAARGGSIEDQIDETLALGLELFGFDAAYVLQFQSDRVLIGNSIGNESPLRPGSVYPDGALLARFLRGERTTLEIPDLDHSEWRDDPARTTLPWRSYFGMQLEAGEGVYGALAFTSFKPRDGAIEAGDRDLLQLMGLFVSAALERAKQNKHIEQLAFHDPLTGLPNRIVFEDRIAHTIVTARRYDRGFAVMYLDLDRFKHVNDTYGHHIGDEVLKAVADRLRGALRESDTVSRFGGDEFVILQPVVDASSESADLARKIHTALQEPVVVKGVSHSVHASIGIALYPSDANTIEGLMEAADRALYRAKREGRNRWRFSDAQSARAGFKKAK
jgi:diguanylate cyclase (GGDEF)-like protein/PAS domain S-box-containing protein